LFKERRKLALLSLLSALVVISTAFVGISIYAQTDGSELTTFEEEEMAAGENVDSAGNATGDGSTSIADVESLLSGLQVCHVSTSEVSGNETEVAAAPEDVTPTVSIEVMTETEVAELAANETETAGNETSIASADCMVLGGTSTSGNATDSANETSTTGNTTATLGTNETSTASAPESDQEILVIEGQDFLPGQIVLMFSAEALVGIDDVSDNGDIEAKIPMPEGGETAVAGNVTASTGTELRLVESGTQRTATFELDGGTATAGAGGDIELEGAEGGDLTAAPSGNTTSTNNTGTSNNSIYSPQ
jgi:hypothetical protein